MFFSHETFVWYLGFIVSWWFPMNLFGAIFLTLFGFYLYSLSKNQYLVILPLVYSIAWTGWHIVRHAIKYFNLILSDAPANVYYDWDTIDEFLNHFVFPALQQEEVTNSVVFRTSYEGIKRLTMTSSSC